MKLWSSPVVITLLLLGWANLALGQAEGGVLTVATGFADIFSLVSSHVEEFHNLTGIQVIVTQRPFDSLFDDLLLDLQQGSPLFDMFVHQISTLTHSTLENLVHIRFGPRQAESAWVASHVNLGLLTSKIGTNRCCFHPCRFIVSTQWIVDLVDCKKCNQVRQVILAPAPRLVVENSVILKRTIHFYHVVYIYFAFRSGFIAF